MNINKKLIFNFLMVLPLIGCAVAIIPAVGTAVIINEDRRTLGTFIEDQNIELKAINELFNDKAVKDGSHVNVTSYSKKVLVTGEATTEEVRKRIIDIVRHVREVAHVYDELTIAKPSSLMSRSKDSLISAKAKINLLKMKNFSGLHIKAVTEKGVIYLMGLVSKSEGEIATEYMRQISGVKQVVQLFEYID